MVPICNFKNCLLTYRHYNRRKFNKNINNNNINELTHFYIELIDSLHYYMTHLFQCGLRTINNNNNECKMDGNKFMDEQFKIISENIENTEKRFKSSKLNINVLNNETEEEKSVIINFDE